MLESGDKMWLKLKQPLASKNLQSRTETHKNWQSGAPCYFSREAYDHRSKCCLSLLLLHSRFPPRKALTLHVISVGRRHSGCTHSNPEELRSLVWGEGISKPGWNKSSECPVFELQFAVWEVDWGIMLAKHTSVWLLSSLPWPSPASCREQNRAAIP